MTRPWAQLPLDLFDADGGARADAGPPASPGRTVRGFGRRRALKSAKTPAVLRPRRVRPAPAPSNVRGHLERDT